MLQDDNLFSCSPLFDFFCSPFLSAVLPLFFPNFLFQPHVLFSSTSLTTVSFFITALSLQLCLPLCPQSQQIYSGEWVQSASCGEYLHTKWSQPDFNEAAAISLELLFIRLMSDHQRCSLVVLFYHFSLMRERGKWPYCHKLHHRFPHLNGLISRMDACWPK